MLSCLITGKLINIDMLAGQTCQCANCQAVRIKDYARRSQDAMIREMLIPKGKLFMAQLNLGEPQ